MSMCCKDSVFITKFQAYQGMKSQNSKVFKRVYHKIPRFLSWFITKFQGFQVGLSQNSKVFMVWNHKIPDNKSGKCLWALSRILLVSCTLCRSSFGRFLCHSMYCNASPPFPCRSCVSLPCRLCRRRWRIGVFPCTHSMRLSRFLPTASSCRVEVLRIRYCRKNNFRHCFAL